MVYNESSNNAWFFTANTVFGKLVKTQKPLSPKMQDSLNSNILAVEVWIWIFASGETPIEETNLPIHFKWVWSGMSGHALRDAKSDSVQFLESVVWTWLISTSA